MSTTLTKLPAIDVPTLLQAVPTMLRNCLIAKNSRLVELDFNHLQMYIPSLTDSEDKVNGTIIIKAGSEARYKLESKQTFTYTRIEADEGLKALGFTERSFAKEQYNDVVKLLNGVGTFTIIEGDVANPMGDAAVMFTFGDRNTSGYTPARYIDIGSDAKNKTEYDVAFKGQVRFTFVGEPISPQDGDGDEGGDEDNDGLVDIAPFFLNTRLGDVFKANKPTA